MIFNALASSSAGNAYTVSDGQTNILLECGLAFRTLQKKAGFTVSQFNACLITHEHKDHAKCASDMIASGIPTYMSAGTADALEVTPTGTVAHGEQFSVGTLDIVPFNTFHDAAEPLGFLIRSQIDGDTLAFATDTVNLAYRFPGITMLAIEANYDKAILERCERIPEKVRYRITNTHMEIETLCSYLRGLDLTSCREVYLCHLSDATSHEGHFINKVARCVPGNTRVTACAAK